MTTQQAARQLLDVSDRKTARGETAAITGDTLCVALARIGAQDQRLAAFALKECLDMDMGRPLHSLVIPTSDLHSLEEEALRALCKLEAS